MSDQLILNLRPVACTERESGRVIEVDGMAVGVRFGSIALLKEAIKSSSVVQAVVYHAGLLSRDPEFGHGYIGVFTTDGLRFEVPQTDWAAEDHFRTLAEQVAPPEELATAYQRMWSGPAEYDIRRCTKLLVKSCQESISTAS